MEFPLHTPATAPAAAVPMLEATQKAYGFLPNLYGMFASSPVALATYGAIQDALKAHAALTPQEQQLVMLTVSEENGCEYCVAAHTMVAGMSQVAPASIEAVRQGEVPADSREAALVRFARSVVVERGWVPEAVQDEFTAAGFTAQHALDVLSIVALKTLSNFTNHLAATPLDDAFAAHRWTAVR